VSPVVAGIRHAVITGVATPSYKKPFIDMMENVFAGVHISTDDETAGRADDSEPGPRPWLSGLTMSKVHVRLSRDDEPEHAKPRKR
jgi:hypothetical protein